MRRNAGFFNKARSRAWKLIALLKPLIVIARSASKGRPLLALRAIAVSAEWLRLFLALRPFLGVLLLGDVPGVLERGGALGVHGRELRPLRRHVGFRENGLHGAFRHACFTVDAIDRVDVKHH